MMISYQLETENVYLRTVQNKEYIGRVVCVLAPDESGSGQQEIDLDVIRGPDEIESFRASEIAEIKVL